ncbi:MAG: TlpA family protein disulfide reductase [Bacteroidota bacterium]|nr:TlpA family protein disulfide reductase [Bacteroidota bacterium]
MFYTKYHPEGCKAIALLFISIFFFKASAQNLQLNDYCPDVTATTVLNYQLESLKLSDFKDKAIIIDFWNTRCHSCIKSFPKIDSLQKIFGKELQFLLVTNESKKTVTDFFIKRKNIKPPAVPMIVEDTVLANLFPADGYPYTVWLDEARKIRFITSGYNVTALHIEKFLEDKPLSMRYSAAKIKRGSLWEQEPGLYKEKLSYYSYITPCITGINIGSENGVVVNKNQSIKISSACTSILELLKKAFREGDPDYVPTKYGMDFQVRDSGKYFLPENTNEWDTWRENNTYNYELVLPEEKRGLLYKTMQEDLLRYFNFSAIRTMKKIDGYTLVVIDKSKPFKSKGGKPKDSYNDANVLPSDSLFFINQPMNRLTSLLRVWLGYYYPIKDLTAYSGDIDIIIRKSSIGKLNIERLRQDLQKAGFDLQLRKMETDVLIVKED